jgi:hypothetical protein
MQRTGMRVMYWPNEPAHLYPEGAQSGGRLAFDGMALDGTIAELSTYSFLRERARHASPDEFERAALEAVRAFAPDILFVQHLVGSGIEEAFWTTLRREVRKMTIVYHEDDPFDRFSKRIDRSTRAILPVADLVLLSGLGDLAALFAANGARNIGYMPSCFDEPRFARHDPTKALKQYDIVMIGSEGRRQRLKFAYLPGGRRRAKLATQLSNAFGSRFVLHGRGWAANPSARGAIPFASQEAAIQSGRISANWDHFDHIDYYFSDRLPISLAAGVPHVTTYHAGYDRLFGTCPGLYACASVKEAVDTCRWLLSRNDDALMEEGLCARTWAFAHLEAQLVFRNALEQATRVHRPVQAA